MHTLKHITSFLLILLTPLYSAEARTQIRIVGSTAVYPFATLIAERFGRSPNQKTPVVEATGTGGGIKVFCSGIGEHYPDIVNTSRPMNEDEMSMCEENGIGAIEEHLLGYDGIVIGRNNKSKHFVLTRKQLFLALAERIPSSTGKWIINPHKKWSDIDRSLPYKKIMVLGPTSTLATREVFEEKIIKEVCKELGGDDETCAIRQDGVFIEVAEHENVIVQKLHLNPEAVGIFSYGFLNQNRNKVSAISIDGVTPTEQTIRSRRYLMSRPLYMYAKSTKLSSTPDLSGYIAEFTKHKRLLQKNGLIF